MGGSGKEKRNEAYDAGIVMGIPGGNQVSHGERYQSGRYPFTIIFAENLLPLPHPVRV